MALTILTIAPSSSSGPALSLVAAVAVMAAVLGACSEPPPTLQVGELEFHDDQVRTLSEDQLMRLGRIGAVGLAVRDGRILELGHPILLLREEAALQERLREELMLQWAGVDDQVLEARYRTQPELELTARHLVVLSERWRPAQHREAARHRARQARERIHSGEPFPEVAGEVSEEPGAAERGGLLEPGRRGTWVTEFWEAAGALDEGEVSPVVETEYGFHVLKLEDRSEVPFHEARDRIASEVAGMVPGRARWEEWVAERIEGIVLHLDSLEEGLPAPGDSAMVARWDDARLLAGELSSRIAGLPADTVRRFREGDPAVRRQVVRNAALVRILAAEAHQRGIRVPPHVRATLEREWERTVRGWASTFEFEDGLSLNQVGRRALAALTRTGQNLDIARREVERHGPALQNAYPIVIGTP